MGERQIPRQGDFYKHFKGNLYQIRAIAIHSETKERMVVYQALYGDFETYVRPLTMFLSEVDKEKYPMAAQNYRFEKCNRGDWQESKLPKEAIERELIQETELEKAEPKEIITQRINTSKKELEIEEAFMLFLDADTYQEKLELLLDMKEKLNDRILTNIAVSMDIPIDEGTIEERFALLKQNLETYARFECNRFR